MKIDDSIFAVKLYEMAEQYGDNAVQDPCL